MDLDAVFAVETVSDVFAVGVQFVENDVRVALVAGCEGDDLELFRHSFEEADCVGTDADVGVGVGAIFNLDGNDDIVRFARIFLTVNESLVNVNNQSFLSLVSRIPRQTDLLGLDTGISGGAHALVISEDFQGHGKMLDGSLIFKFKGGDQM